MVQWHYCGVNNEVISTVAKDSDCELNFEK